MPWQMHGAHGAPGTWYEVTLGPPSDMARFTLEHYPTCHRRGPWKLSIDAGPRWGCFDEQDQPVRWYHLRKSALAEAEAIAEALLTDRYGQDREQHGVLKKKSRLFFEDLLRGSAESATI